MKKIVLAALAATLMLSSGAWAGFSIHVDNNKKSERRNDPPPPPPPPRERLEWSTSAAFKQFKARTLKSWSESLVFRS